jgi:hypothetical protein
MVVTSARGLRLKAAMTACLCHPGLEPGSMVVHSRRWIAGQARTTTYFSRCQRWKLSQLATSAGTFAQ